MDFHPALDLVLFNGAPRRRASWCLRPSTACWRTASREADGRWVTRPDRINLSKTDEDLPTATLHPTSCFWAAYRWTGDKKYLLPFNGRGPVVACRAISSDALDMLNLRDTWGKQLWWRRQDHGFHNRSGANRGRNPLPGLPNLRLARSAAIRNISTGSTDAVAGGIEPRMDQYRRQSLDSIA